MNSHARRSLSRNLLLAFTVISIGFWYWSQWVSESPLAAPIDLTVSGSVEKLVQLRVSQPYELSFEFTRGGPAHERVGALVGEMGLCGSGPNCGKGVPIEVEWSLTDPRTQHRVAGSRVMTSDANGFSNLEVWRRIGEVNVPPAKYILRVTVLQAAPELEILKPAIRLALYPKDTTSWQMFVVWWGSLILPLVVVPASLIAAYAWYRSTT